MSESRQAYEHRLQRYRFKAIATARREQRMRTCANCGRTYPSSEYAGSRLCACSSVCRDALLRSQS